MFGWKRGSQAPGGRPAGGEGQGLGDTEQRQLPLALLARAQRQGHMASGAAT